MSADTMAEEQELTLEQVAAELNVSYATARKRVLDGLIPARREGLEWRVTRSDLEEYKRKTRYYPKKK